LSSLIRGSQILNNICSEDYKDIIDDPTLAFGKLGIENLVHHLKSTSRHIIASRSSQAAQREEIYNMINYFEAPTLVFYNKPCSSTSPMCKLILLKRNQFRFFLWQKFTKC
jgi:hypothetical protein